MDVLKHLHKQEEIIQTTSSQTQFVTFQRFQTLRKKLSPRFIGIKCIKLDSK